MNSRALAEQAFESRVEEELVSRGWVQAQGTFSPDICIDAGEMYRFIGATQINAWERLIGLHGDQPTAQRRFAQRVAAEIDARGVLDVLRQGVRDRGVQIDLAYFRPGHTLAADALAEYHANVLAVAWQLRYSVRDPHRSVDIDAAVDSIDLQLDLLAERRQALITAAVTGAIDVTTAHGLD
jgi:type I restriction enzyme, R subunit